VVAGLLRRPWGYALGSALQVPVVAAGFVVPAMFLLGAVFAGLWFFALYLGRRVEHLQAQRAATEPDGDPPDATAGR